MLFDIYRRARGYLGERDFGRVGTIEAESSDEADQLWWEKFPDRDGLVAGQWAEPAPPDRKRATCSRGAR